MLNAWKGVGLGTVHSNVLLVGAQMALDRLLIGGRINPTRIEEVGNLKVSKA